MRLSTPELRSRAAAFARDWASAHYEKGETQSFWNDFFQIFGKSRRSVGIYEQNVRLLGGGSGFIDLFWRGVLLVEQKSAGRDLARARRQALDYIAALPDVDQPTYLLLSDFQIFELFNFETREEARFTLADLPRHIERFLFIQGDPVRTFKDQDPVNIRAAELVGALHDALEASGYTGHRLEVFLTRIVFCLFADDTRIFEPRDILMDWLDLIADPRDMGPRLAQLFDVLNQPENLRQSTLDPDLARFPYVNGHLFAEYFPPPSFNEDMRVALLNACRFDWTPISPAIFGSLFQSVMDKAERRRKGAHYTTEKNILKLIGPLFLDDLKAEFATLKARRSGKQKELQRFHDKLASLTFFDPACGCGNFLVITYRELRALELELLLTLHPEGQRTLDAAALSRIDVDQFYGIEIEEFPARIAETALWMMDHLMNLRLSEAFGGYYPRIPLKKSPTILHGDALEVDWADVLPPERCSYVLGNPPFIGQSYQSPEQREHMRRLTNPAGKNGSPLDFVGAWFLKAGEYVGRGLPRLSPPARIAFVSTNSITQGEQVELLWPQLFDRYNLEIAFAHRTFEWGSDARGKAHVHVVIIGLDRREGVRAERRLFSYPKTKGEPVETQHKAISPYLVDASNLANPHLIVRESTVPLTPRAKMELGVKMVDDGHFTFSTQEKETFLAAEPNAAGLFHEYIGGQEYINGTVRWCLAFEGASLTLLRQLPKVRARISLVRAYREQSPKEGTRRLALTPTLYECGTIPTEPFLVVPNVSSEKREYIPIGWMTPPAVPNQKLRVLPKGASLSDLAILTSAMHMAWMRAITGRMKSDYMYSVGVVYNTFPLPPNAEGGRGPTLKKLEPLAQAILDARAAHPGATLATLYDPDLMPPNLRRAHTDLDRAVDRLYRPAGFASDRERVEHLFALYEAMVAPLLSQPKKRRRVGLHPATPTPQTLPPG